MAVEDPRPFDVTPLEMQRLFRLGPNVAENGLWKLLHDRMNPSLEKLGRGEALAPEELWQLDAHCAVQAVLMPHESSEPYNPRKALERTVRYMKFLGFPEEELSPKGVADAAQRFDLGLDPHNREVEEGVIDFSYRQAFKRPSTPRRKPTEEDFAVIKRSNERRAWVVGVDGRTLGTLDTLMELRDSFPSYDEFVSSANRALEVIMGMPTRRSRKK